MCFCTLSCDLKHLLEIYCICHIIFNLASTYVFHLVYITHYMFSGIVTEEISAYKPSLATSISEDNDSDTLVVVAITVPVIVVTVIVVVALIVALYFFWKKKNIKKKSDSGNTHVRT